MGWVKLSDDFNDHPKVVAAGPMAGWLYLCGLTYSARLLTDGFIPTAQVARLTTLRNAPNLAKALVNVGLWEETAGGYQIHNYEEWQTDSETIRERRRKDSERKRRGLRMESERNPNGIRADSMRRSRSRSRKEVPPLPPQDATSPSSMADDVAGGTERPVGGGNALPGEMCAENKRRVAEAKASLVAGQKIP